MGLTGSAQLGEPSGHPQLLPCTQGWPQRQQPGRIRVGWGGGVAAAVPHLGIAPRVWVGLRSISVA